MIKENKELGFYYSENRWKLFYQYFVICGLWWGIQSMNWIWLMKYFKKQKWGRRSDLKRYKSEENIKRYMDKCKSLKKRKEKAFMEEVKAFQPKTTLQLPTLFNQHYPGKFRSTTHHNSSWKNFWWQSISINFFKKYCKK